MKELMLQKSWLLRMILNLWPPFLLSGIKVIELAKDFSYCKIKLKNWPGTKNINGTQFGGNLFAMTDALYGTMLMAILKNKYYVWDKFASIDFKSPGKGTVFTEAILTKETIAEIKANTAQGEKYFPEFNARVFDKDNNDIAIVKRVLYVRLKPTYRKA